MTTNSSQGPTLGRFGHRDPDARGYFGAYGGGFVPETLVAPVGLARSICRAPHAGV